MRELDTITDLVEYLDRKEALLTHPTRTVMASGEEQLVAMYLTRVDEHGRHNFVGIPDDATGVYIDEGHWEDFIRSPQYLAKKNADKVSYAWDRLIEHLSARGEVGLGDDRKRDIAAMEPGLRILASESRLARRQYADQLLGALHKNVPPGSRFLRVGYSKQASDTAYVFLILPQPPFIKTYDEYREARCAMLLACCKVARLRAPDAARIVGLVTEPRGTKGASEDLLVLDLQSVAWGPAQDEEARRLQAELGILLDDTAEAYERHEVEFPDVPQVRSNLSPAERLTESARLRALAKIKVKGRPKRKRR